MPRPAELLRAALLAALLGGSAALPPSAAGQQPVPTAPVDTTAAPSPGISPRGAFLRSLVIPGWGQSALGARTRGGIYFALEAGSLWMVLKTRERLEEARAEDRLRLAVGTLPPGEESSLVDARQDQLEDWITLSVFWLLFSGADAYVTAYLSDFDERVDVVPDPSGGLRVQTSFPVGGRP